MVQRVDHISAAVLQLMMWLTSLLVSPTRICSVAARSRSIHSATAGSVSDPSGLGMVPIAIPYVFLCLRIATTRVFQASQLLWVSSMLSLSCLANGVMAIGARDGGLE